MRQRIAIATAMLNRPAVLVADEPTTALDVTIQAQILFEVQKLAEETGTAMIWITHDLSVVSGLADRIAIMYAGRLVEQGPVRRVLDRPGHHYTAGLLNSIPSSNEPGRPLRQIPGSPPALGRLVGGCTFRPRCAAAQADCTTVPKEVQIGESRLLCHHPRAEALK
jgi:peptide/nickel transport system ATP-binding protein